MTRKYLELTSLAERFAAQFLATEDRDEIMGRVTDSSGTVVPGARVTVVQKGTNASHKSATRSADDVTLPALPVRVYQAKVEHYGLKMARTENAEITPGATLRSDVSLEVGQAARNIEVSANAPLAQTEYPNRAFVAHRRTERAQCTWRENRPGSASMGEKWEVKLTGGREVGGEDMIFLSYPGFHGVTCLSRRLCREEAEPGPDCTPSIGAGSPEAANI